MDHLNFKLQRALVPLTRTVGILLIVLALLVSCAERAQLDSEHIRVSLVSEQSTIAPGRPFWIGLLKTLDDGWHTYWRNPGDSGAPARINWYLPDGWTASPIHWPIPEIMPFEGMMNYGYSGQVLLPILITPPAHLQPGKIELTAEAIWLVCSDVCIPGKGRLSLTLRVGPDLSDAKEKRLFDQWRSRIPRTLKGARAKRYNNRLVISMPLTDVDESQQIWFFPHNSGVVTHGDAQDHMVTDSGSLEISVEPGSDFSDRLDGLVTITTASDTRGFVIDVPIEDEIQPDA